MTAIVNIVVNQIDDALAAGFDQIKVYRSPTETGTFTEITTPSTRIPLVAGVQSYQFIDSTGDSTFFYQTSFLNSTTTAESSRSAAKSGLDDPALDICSVEELKSLYLFGVDLTDDAGNPMPDSLFAHYIRAAVSWLETKLDIIITPTTITDERQDFYRQDYYKYMWTQTDRVPVCSVDSLKLVLPTDQEVITFQQEWIHLFKESGQINIVPGQGQISVITLGQSGAWLPLIYGWTDFIPEVFRIDYTAGFKKGKVPAIIKDVVGKIAAQGPLNIAGDLIVGAGIASQSLSIDGLSQSINTTSSATNSGYGSRILQYTKEIKDAIPQLRRTFHPVGLAVA